MDENIPKNVAMALDLIQSSLNEKYKENIKVTHIQLLGMRGLQDEKWVQKLDNDDENILITIDKDFKNNPGLRLICRERKISVILIINKGKNSTVWEITLRLFNKWEELKTLSTKIAKPFLIELPKASIKKPLKSFPLL